ncbi:MAG TPA: hypothetical protein VMG13_08830, partial [Trebonia sp.]|nr:hypothetical protein [Trebonia sp.]
MAALTSKLSFLPGPCLLGHSLETYIYGRKPRTWGVSSREAKTTVPAADRARGALYGLAIGDALGMPTQLLS